MERAKRGERPERRERRRIDVIEPSMNATVTTFSVLVASVTVQCSKKARTHTHIDTHITEHPAHTQTNTGWRRCEHLPLASTLCSLSPCLYYGLEHAKESIQLYPPLSQRVCRAHNSRKEKSRTSQVLKLPFTLSLSLLSFPLSFSLSLSLSLSLLHSSDTRT